MFFPFFFFPIAGTKDILVLHYPTELMDEDTKNANLHRQCGCRGGKSNTNREEVLVRML